MEPTNQIQFAAIMVPILALVVSTVTNSVDDKDGWYAPFILFCSLASLGPITVVVSLSLLSIGINVDYTTILVYSGISIGFTLFLMIGVTLKETLPSDFDNFKSVRYGVAVVILLLFYIVLVTSSL